LTEGTYRDNRGHRKLYADVLNAVANLGKKGVTVYQPEIRPRRSRAATSSRARSFN
jgi:hypothetical protein